MSAPSPTREAVADRDRDFDRLLTFVDAIVAIAITLLVLPLVDLASQVRGGGSVSHLLHEHSDELWAFVLSFYVIARIWLGQHDAVGPLRAGNSRITTLLIAWSFTIVVLPFPTSLVATAGEQAATKIFYVGTMALSVLIIAVLRAEILRHPELTDWPPQRRPLGGAVSAALLLVALVLMLAFPAISYYPMLLLLLEGPAGRALGSLGIRATT